MKANEMAVVARLIKDVLKNPGDEAIITRVRKEVVSDTVSLLLQRAAARRQASLNTPTVPTIDPRPLSNGRVP